MKIMSLVITFVCLMVIFYGLMLVFEKPVEDNSELKLSDKIFIRDDEGVKITDTKGKIIFQVAKEKEDEIIFADLSTSYDRVCDSISSQNDDFYDTFTFYNKEDWIIEEVDGNYIVKYVGRR